MSKNLTRKSLAFGALIALGSSVFAGAPAFAGVESAKVTLVPTLGTTYNTLIGASFDLKTEIDSTIESTALESKDAADLSYIVTNASAQKIKIDLDGKTGANFGDIQVQSADALADLAGSYTGTFDAVDYSTKKVIVVTHHQSGNGSTQSADVAGDNTIRLTTSTDSTDPFSVTVQAWLDDDNDGKIDTFEYTSPVRTLNFIKASAATVTTEVTSAVIGSSKLQAKVVLGNELNQEALASQVKVKFFKNGSARYMHSGTSAPTNNNTSVDSVDVVIDSTKTYLKNDAFYPASKDATDGLTLAAGTYTAKAYFVPTASAPSYILLGAESAGVGAVAGTSASADYTDVPRATNNENVKTTYSGSGSTLVAAVTARTAYTGDIAFTSYVLTQDTHDSANANKVAGVTVKVTLTKGTTFTAGHEVTAGGKTLTSTSGAVSFETTTDAKGKFTFAAKSNKGTKSDSFKVLVQVLRDTNGFEDGDEAVVTFSDATIASVVSTDLAGYGGQIAIAKGAALSLNYQVRDSFGALSAVAGSYRLAITDGSNVGGGTVDGTAAVSAGKATYSFTDNTVATSGSYDVIATLEKLNAAGDTYSSSDAAVSGVSALTIKVQVGGGAVTAITVPADTATGSELTLESEDFVAHDLRLDTNSKSWSSIGFTSTGYTVTGYATTATGAAAPGAAVTIAAPNAQFVVRNGASDDTTALLALGTVTVRTDSAGKYSVVMLSHTAGSVKVNVTSGSVTKSAIAKFAYPSAANKDSKLTVTGANTTKSGRSTSYIVTLTDKWGNVVKKTGGESVVIEQSGAGYLATTPLVVSATSGRAILTLITQPGDAGLTTLSATFDVAGTDPDIVATKDILVGVTAKITKAATSKVTIKNANGLAVKVVRGTKSATKTATSDSYKVSLKGGTGTVSVYVNGIKVASK